MKVLFIAGWFPQDGNYKGIFIREHAFAVARKHPVAVIYGEENTQQKEKFRFAFSTEDNLQILRFTYRKIPLFSSYPRYVKGVVMAFEKFVSQGFTPDIIHACIYFTGIPANIIKQKYNIPYVIREGYSGLPRHALRKTKIKKARIGMGNAEYILPVSYALEKDILSFGIKGRFEVVPNTVPDFFCYNPGVQKNADNTKRILCVARMHPCKNIPNLINACVILLSHRKDFQVNLVGEGEKIEEYRKSVRDASLDSIFHFLGSKTKEEIASMMQGSAFSILPSKYEALPNVLIESVACGLPVVATRVGGIPEIIDDSNGILVESDNSQALSEAMNWMLDNADRYDRKSISLNARKKYSYETIGAKITAIYEKALTSYKQKMA